MTEITKQEISDWREIANGVWKTRIGPGKIIDLLSFSGVSPRFASMDSLPNTDFPFRDETISYTISGSNTVIEIPYSPKEKLYGLGLNFKNIEIQQSVRHLHVDHFGGKDNGRTHAPVPFYVSSKGYGVFINAAVYLTVYCGGTHHKENPPPAVDRQSPDWQVVIPGQIVEIVVPQPGTEIMIFGGPTVLDAVRRFNLYCGGGCLPPRWGLGFWHRVPMEFDHNEIEKEVKEFRDNGFPLDVLGLEPGWHTQSYPTTYEWHSERFPDPAGFLKKMKDNGVRVNLWENCFVSPDCRLGKRLKPLSGNHTGGWGGYIPDLSLPETRDIIAEQHKSDHLKIGVSGYKLDECDGYDQWLWPDHTNFPSGLTGEQLRQVYGVLFQRTTTELYHKHNLRTYGLVRASNAGSVSFPYVIYNDYYDHRDFITALCSAGFCGLLWTPEVRASKSGEDFLRRMQTACFSPLAMINAWADGTKPWSFPEVRDAVLAVMKLRNRFIPYFYSAFAQYYFDGTPPFRAMVLDNDFITGEKAYQRGELDATENPYSSAEAVDVKDQFMAGPSLLVAPIFAEETERQVILPKGDWFDFYTGKLVGSGPGEITVKAELETIPLFVRDGGIIPLVSTVERSENDEKIDLELRHYGNSEGNYRLYDDDGITDNYEKGEFCWIDLSVKRDQHGKLSGDIKLTANKHPFVYKNVTWRFMT